MTVDDPVGEHWHAEDVVTGRLDGDPVVTAIWDMPNDERGRHVRAYRLPSGDPCGPPLTSLDLYPLSARRLRLGRWSGQPVVAREEYDTLHLHDVRHGDLLAEPMDLPPESGPGVLAVDDAAGPNLVVVGRAGGTAVSCHDVDHRDLVFPDLTGYEGTLRGAHLGRLHDRPVVALRTSTGASLYDITSPGWVRHLNLGVAVRDAAFAPDGRLAIATGHGPGVIDILP
jgi:hypothetical protein